MDMLNDRTGLEVLSREECLLLLRQHHIGRIAVVSGSRPAIMPVNYAMADEDVVFRSADGLKVSAAGDRQFVAFEIDGHDEIYQTGWSVLVSGWGHAVSDPVERDALRQLPLRPWAPGDKPHWVRIRPDAISGRRIRPAGAPPH